MDRPVVLVCEEEFVNGNGTEVGTTAPDSETPVGVGINARETELLLSPSWAVELDTSLVVLPVE